MLHPSFVEITPPVGLQQKVGTTNSFRRDSNFYYPDKLVLLESMIKTLLKEEKPTTWKTHLKVWAVPYMCGYLDVDVGALDGCDNENGKAWYDTATRDQGGLNRMTNKRTGKAY